MTQTTKPYVNGNKPKGRPNFIMPPDEYTPEEPDWMREQNNVQPWGDLGVWAPLPKTTIKGPAPAPAPDEGTRPYKFERLSMDDLEALPPKKWIIENVIGAGDLAMVYGPPGCGKTFVEIDMIFAACLGRQFAMRFDVGRPLNVAYCAGEGNSGLPQRFKAARKFYGAEDEAFPNFSYFKTSPQFYTDDRDAAQAASIRDFVYEWKQRQEQGETESLDILIIDTLHSATAGADENSARDMGIVLQAAKFAITELNCAVIFVHHTNKNGSAERGSSAIRGSMDCMIEIKRPSDTSTKAVMICAKLKDGEAWKPQTFDLVSMGDSVRVWWNLPANDEGDGDKRKSETAREILELLAEVPERSMSAKKISEVLAKLPQSVNKVVARLVLDGTIKRSEDNRRTLVYTVTELGIEALSQSGKV